MSTKLCAIVAVVNGKKTRTQKEVTDVYHKFQKPLFDGLLKTFIPAAESTDTEGRPVVSETFPDEKKKVIYTVEQAFKDIQSALSDTIDVTATQDYANCKAKSDVMVNGKVVLSQVPVTHLLWLEKQLVDLRTNLNTIPTLDPKEDWFWDANVSSNATQPEMQNKTKKMQKVLVKYAATKEHPAQTEMVTEDVVIGKWKTIKYSSAISEDTKRIICQRADKLVEAVKMAREEANQLEVENVKNADKIFEYVFGK
jgi:hypothetical protein